MQRFCTCFLLCVFLVATRNSFAATNSVQFGVCKNISGALRKGLPLATVVNPKEFSGIDTKVVLAATARVKAYGVYRTHPKKFNEEDIIQGGFNYCSSEVFFARSLAAY